MRPMIVFLMSLAVAGASPEAPRSMPAAAFPAASAAVRDTARVRLGTPESGTTAFVAWPAGNKPAAAVIVVHEWWGLNEQIRIIARRLAQEGYVAIVPDLYHGRVADEMEMAHELSRGLDEERALGDIEAAAGWLRGQPRVRRSRIAVVGFCMGGRLSQLHALRSSGLAAAVMFYGRPETDPGKLAALKAPLQGHFGQEDRGIGPEQIGALKAGLAKAGKVAEVHVYPGAGHAFMHEGRASHHADAARQAWARTLTFLQKHLKG